MKCWLILFVFFQFVTNLCFAQSIDTAILMGRYTTQDLTINTTKVVQNNVATGKKLEPIHPEELQRVSETVQNNLSDAKSEQLVLLNEPFSADVKEPSVREQIKHR